MQDAIPRKRRGCVLSHLPISCCAVTAMPSATTVCPTATQAFAGLTMNEVTVAVVLSVDGGLAASAHWHLLEGSGGPLVCGAGAARETYADQRIEQ